MRLSNRMREQISHNVVNDTFGDEFNLARKQISDALLKCYCTMYQAELAACENIPKKVRDKIVLSTNCVYRVVDGPLDDIIYKIPSGIGRTSYTSHIPVEKVYAIDVVRTSYACLSIHQLKTSHPEIHTAFVSAVTAMDILNTKIIAFRKQLDAVLDSVTTDKKLLEIMPELAKYIKQPVPQAPQQNLLPLEVINSVRAVLTASAKKE